MRAIRVAILWASGATAFAGAPRGDRVVEPGVISTAAAEVRIAYRPDGRQIAWGSIGRNADAGQQDIWEMHRTANGWSPPARASFDTDAVEFDPAFSQDSKHLYFDSDRAGGYGGTDVYVVDVDVTTNQFSAPRNVGPRVNSKGDEWAATPTPRGSLIFSSDGWGGEGKHDLFESDPQLKQAPRNLGREINGPEEDFDAALGPDGKTLVFSSGTMSDTETHVRLFRSQYTGKAWTAREELKLGCSDFVIGPAFATGRPNTLYYSAKCPDGLGRMDIREVELPKAAAPAQRCRGRQSLGCLRGGTFSGSPAVWSSGMVGLIRGRFLIRACVTASNPDASVINFGSLNAVPKNVMPKGIPNTWAAGTWT